MSFFSEPRKSITNFLFGENGTQTELKDRTRRNSLNINRLSTTEQGTSINEHRLKEAKIELEHAKMQVKAENDRLKELKDELDEIISSKYNIQ